jgi:quinoprotein dehydrogenase-associated probable ABC transporter substrate-binding protein
MIKLYTYLRLAIGLLLIVGAVGLAQADPDAKVLRVCADPNNLPLSDKAGHGYENRIAQLIGEELGRPVEYVWFPQRMGFVRNTLRAPRESGGFKCDLIIGVPEDYEMTANTRPYLHSAWTMVFADRPELASLKTPEDVMSLPPEVRGKLRFGVFTHTPPLDWLFDHKLFDQAVPYPALSGDPDEIPGQIVANDLAEGKIDIAMVWGPIGGYFAKLSKTPMRVVPFVSTKQLKFDYQLSLGVRHPDKEWKATLDAIIAKRQADIDAILKDYGIPLLQLPSSAAHAASAPGNS